MQMTWYFENDEKICHLCHKRNKPLIIKKIPVADLQRCGNKSATVISLIINILSSRCRYGRT